MESRSNVPFLITVIGSLLSEIPCRAPWQYILFLEDIQRKMSARNHRNESWLANRISDIARDLYTTSTKKKLRHKHTTTEEDPSVNKHDKIVEQASIRTAICYTDGSATPNPGPSGAGASIFLRNPDRVHDLGVSTGLGTN